MDDKKRAAELVKEFIEASPARRANIVIELFKLQTIEPGVLNRIIELMHDCEIEPQTLFQLAMLVSRDAQPEHSPRIMELLKSGRIRDEEVQSVLTGIIADKGGIAADALELIGMSSANNGELLIKNGAQTNLAITITKSAGSGEVENIIGAIAATYKTSNGDMPVLNKRSQLLLLGKLCRIAETRHAQLLEENYEKIRRNVGGGAALRLLDSVRKRISGTQSTVHIRPRGSQTNTPRNTRLAH